VGVPIVLGDTPVAGSGGWGEERIIAVLNLREVHWKILALLGTVYEQVYLC
jgi:hypothetical protein